MKLSPRPVPPWKNQVHREGREMDPAARKPGGEAWPGMGTEWVERIPALQGRAQAARQAKDPTAPGHPGDRAEQPQWEARLVEGSGKESCQGEETGLGPGRLREGLANQK